MNKLRDYMTYSLKTISLGLLGVVALLFLTARIFKYSGVERIHKKPIPAADTLKTMNYEFAEYNADSSVFFIQGYVDVYQLYYLVLITSDRDQAVEYINRHLNGKQNVKKEELDNCSGITFYKPGKAPVIWIESFDYSAEDISVLNHELLHLTYYITESTGIKQSEASEEAYAYLLQTLSRKTYSKIYERI